MTQIIEVIYDGKVLKPCDPVHLKKNCHYKIQIEIEEEKSQEVGDNPLFKLIGGVEHGSLATDIDKELYGLFNVVESQ
jgi:predicted DNA-binding antitoxin AbrB/MazE fold protein